MAIQMESPTLQLLDEEGFAVLEEFVSQDDINEFESDLSKLCAGQFAQKSFSPTSKDPLIDLFNLGGKYRKVLYGALQNLRITTKIQSKILRFIEEDEILDKLGFQAPMVWSALKCALPYETQYDNPVHQDVYSMISHRAIRFWIPLRAVDSFYGSMRAWPQSHKEGYVPHDDLSNPTYPAVPSRYYDQYTVAEPFDLPAGDAVLFDPLLFHESVKNVSNRVRFICIVDVQDSALLPDFNNSEDDIVKMIALNEQRKVNRAKDAVVKLS